MMNSECQRGSTAKSVWFVGVGVRVMCLEATPPRSGVMKRQMMRRAKTKNHVTRQHQ